MYICGRYINCFIHIGNVNLWLLRFRGYLCVTAQSILLLSDWLRSTPPKTAGTIKFEQIPVNKSERFFCQPEHSTYHLVLYTEQLILHSILPNSTTLHQNKSTTSVKFPHMACLLLVVWMPRCAIYSTIRNRLRDGRDLDCFHAHIHAIFTHKRTQAVYLRSRMPETYVLAWSWYM